MTDKDLNILNITFNFEIEGAIQSIESYGSGHIHETYRLKNRNPDMNDYILQKINTHIFGNVPKLMGNIEYVTEHLRRKLRKIQGANPEKEVLTLVATNSGNSFYKHPDGSYWRMYIFLKGTRSYDLVSTEQQALEGGRAYGRFQALLADLDTTPLFEILPDFHNLDYRINLLNEAIENDPCNRLNEVNEEIEFVKARIVRMKTVLNMGQAGQLPLKTTHNDTKFNNVLLDQNDKAQCVIDLDTVMPGYVAYDFGDAIRTIVNTAAEDEKDLDKIGVNMQLFEAFARGFLQEAVDDLTPDEIESLAYGSLLLPYMIGVRFLTDYLDGDNYFKIHFPGHNLQRARAQFQLTKKLEEQFPRMQTIIKQIVSTQKTKSELSR
ncbi:MAG TPA: aminoglycoside phosphotransferase family protein [Sunxiuqinia sp.]|nr:aminoglycoside phosphotransferase family protein [Sunxiuqinia sp.]